MNSVRSVASLHIIGGRKLGGAERFFVRLVNALAARGEHVAALTVAGGDIDMSLAPNVKRHHAPMAGIWDFYSAWHIHWLGRGYDIVQTYMGRATRLAHWPRHGRPIHIARLGGYYKLAGYRHAHAWVGNTRGICDYMVAGGLPPKRVFYIGNFVDTPPRLTEAELRAMREQWHLPADALVVLGLGRLHPNKGFADLLTAFARLPATLASRPLYLVIVGDGPLRADLHALAASLGIGARLLWTGWQYDPAPWYQLADLFVCSSHHEPLGNVILEAWANGTPVLAYAAQGPSELIEPGVDGLLLPVGDIAGLAQGMKTALTLPQAEKARMVAAARAKLDSQFSEEAIVNAYLDLYRRLLSEL